jgi:hypothetical protein
MAYLSGFSRPRRPTDTFPSNATDMPRPSSSFDILQDDKAKALSSRLHIDKPATITSPSAPSLPKIAVSSASLLGTPRGATLFSAPDPQPASTLSSAPDPAAIEAKLESLVNPGPEAQTQQRPGPSPLVDPGNSSQPSVESVIAEGQRLVQLGDERRSRSGSLIQSISQVMEHAPAPSQPTDEDTEELTNVDGVASHSSAR